MDIDQLDTAIRQVTGGIGWTERRGNTTVNLFEELAGTLGTTVVVVTHELASIFAIGDNAVYLDADTKTMLALGNPKELREGAESAKVRHFLRRGEGAETGAATT